MSKHDEQMKRLAQDAFKTHEITSTGESRWTLKRADGGGHYWVEIACLAGGRLIVHGDIQPSVFQGHSHEVEQLVVWIARSNIGYLAEKAQAGIKSEEAVRTYDDDEAEAYLLDDIREAKERKDEFGEEHLEERLDVLRRALEAVRNGYPEEMHRIICEEIQDGWEWAYSIGRVIAPRVYYAHAAVKRLHALLNVGEQEVSR